MKTRFIEATNVEAGGMNWGKFMLARFDEEEWTRRSAVDQRIQLHARGWTPEHILVMDLQTGEAAMLLPGGSAYHDLEKHAVWVCPLFEPFLRWLYKQDVRDFDKLPALVQIDDPASALSGYRREGTGQLKPGKRYRMRNAKWPVIRPSEGTHPLTGHPVRAVFYEWESGSVSGFGDWDKLEAELGKGEIEELPDAVPVNV